MEKQVFVTKLAGDHILNKKYVRGRISGIAFVMCEDKGRELSYAWRNNVDVDNNTITYEFAVKCTIDQYCEFIDLIEAYYPGLCTPDYKAMLNLKKES